MIRKLDNAVFIKDNSNKIIRIYLDNIDTILEEDSKTRITRFMLPDIIIDKPRDQVIQDLRIEVV